MLIIKTGINIYPKWPFKEIIEVFLANGIDRTFVTIDHPQLDEVMSALKTAGITVDNFHAPYKNQNLIWEDDEKGDVMLSDFTESVDICVKYGVNLLIAHVSQGRPMPPITEAGIARFDKFMAYAKSKGVTVAYECHRYVENVEYMLRRYPDAGFCLDTAHEDAFTPGVRYMPTWGHRLVATHISDNECVCDKDMHMLPFDGHIDFDTTAKEIAESGRDVTLMLELKPVNHEKYKDVSIKDYYTEAAKRVKKLAAMVDYYKSINQEG